MLSDRVVVLTQRPASIQKIISIDLPRPRSLKMRSSIEFAEYSQRVLSIFQAQGILHEGSETARRIVRLDLLSIWSMLLLLRLELFSSFIDRDYSKAPGLLL